MLRVFLSYRRGDSPDLVGRIYDCLRDRFSESHVFMDIETIQAGDDFRERLEAGLRKTDVLLIIIGETWADELDKRNPESDYVRFEIGFALRNGLKVIPLLLNRAVLPQPNQLPSELVQISFFQSARIRSGEDFRSDMEKLIDRIAFLVSGRRKGRSSAIPYVDDTKFVGREAILDDLVSYCRIGRAVTLVGDGGIGKTTIAGALAQKLSYSGNFEGGVQTLSHSFYQRPSVEDAIESLVEQVGAFSLSRRALEQLEEVLAERTSIVVLDGLEVVEGDLDGLLHAVRGSGKCIVIITTLDRTQTYGRAVDILPLRRNDCYKLVSVYGHPTYVDLGDPATIEALAVFGEYVGWNTLALTLAGKYIWCNRVTFPSFLREFQRDPSILEWRDNSKEMSLMRTIGHCFRRVSPDGQILLFRASDLRFESLPEFLLHELSGERAFGLASQLTEFGFWMHGKTLEGIQQYAWRHRLVFEFVREIRGQVRSRAEIREWQKQLVSKLVDYSKGATEEAAEAVYQLEHLANLIYREGNFEALLEIDYHLCNFLTSQGRQGVAASIVELRIQAGRELQPDSLSPFLELASLVHGMLGNKEAALTRGMEALDHATAPIQRGWALGKLGETYRRFKEYDRAREFHWRSVEIAETLAGEGRSPKEIDEGRLLWVNQLSCLGVVESREGKFNDAIVHHDRVIDLAVEFGISDYVCLGKLNKARALLSLKRPQEALELADSILSSRNGPSEGRMYLTIQGVVGQAKVMLGDVETGLTLLDRVVIEARRIGEDEKRWELQFVLAKLLIENGRVSDGVRLLNELISSTTAQPGLKDEAKDALLQLTN